MWKPDKNKEFKINPEIIKKHFDVNQGLNFGEDSARLEENAILPHLTITKETVVLDLGCGNGRWANIMKQKGVKEYYGVDFSKEFHDKNIEKYQNQCGIYFINTHAHKYSSIAKFDIILIIGLMTYMNDDEIIEMANNCKTMLANDGIIVIRNVTIKEGQEKRMVYDREDYQIIRRSPEYDLKLFNQFELVHQDRIKGTGYIYYILKHDEKIYEKFYKCPQCKFKFKKE